MKRLLRKLLNWFEKNDGCVPIAEDSKSFEFFERQITNQEKTVHWTLTPARGGWILFVTHYSDSKSKYDGDRATTLHVITDDKNLGETVARLINLSQISY